MPERSRPPIDVAMNRSGALIYRVDLSPEALPVVRASDLGDGWDAARQAAAASMWGEPRLFRFVPADDDAVDLALTDDDAACWAEAIDCIWGLQTAYGLSICLRLLGLVALLAASPVLRSLCPLERDGARLDPALVRAAASVPLSSRGHLDEERVRAHLAHAAPHLLSDTITHSGVES
ncbi:MAG: hypothetical protein M3N26_04805 [Pseudomonadota bacterium]|nr:hypothetical protein [Pseudomonadota bacterium]